MSRKYDGSRGPPEIEGMTSLKVDNLTYRTTMDDLEHYFGKYGEVGDIYIPRDKHRRESRGFAFVRFREQRDAEDAMDSLDGSVIDGREIRVQLAKYGRPTEPQGGNSHSSRSSGSSRHDRYRSSGRSDRDNRDRRRSRSRSGSRERKRRSRSYSRSPRRRSRSRSDSPRRKPKRDSRSRSQSK